MTSQKDETLRRIRETIAETDEMIVKFRAREQSPGVVANIRALLKARGQLLGNLQARSYDAGYQQGIEDAKKATREAATDDERRDGRLAPSVFTDGILMRLDALKAVDRG